MNERRPVEGTGKLSSERVSAGKPLYEGSGWNYVQISMSARRETAMNTKPLPVAERKSLVAEWAKTAAGKAKEGAALIDVRDPSPREKAHARTLGPRARQALARANSRKAA
jgi:hypothetical protein